MIRFSSFNFSNILVWAFPLFFVFSTNNLFSQCGGTPPTNPPANTNCTNATPITTTGLYTGTTADFAGNNGDNPWLTANGATVENIGYYQFTATATTVSFTACTSCNAGGMFTSGIQFFIFTSCGNSSSKIAILKQLSGDNFNGSPNPPTVYNYGTPTLSASTITKNGSDYCCNFTLSGLTIGETYYWGVDGFNGKNCPYTIQFNGGIETSTTVTPSVTVTGSPTSICVGQSVTYTATPTNGGANPTYQWAVNGTNVGSSTTSNTFTSTSLNNNDVVSVVVTSSDPCASPTTATASATAIQVNTPSEPTFNAIGPFCKNETASALPSSSIENVSGTWNPTTINTSTVGVSDYTFTPSGTGCYTSTQIQITISDGIEPTFNTIGPLCKDGTAPALPSSSIENVSGTWNPATINTSTIGTSNYTFTPSGTGCYLPKQISITVSDGIEPTFAQIAPLCKDVTPPALPASSLENIAGTWNPATINTSTIGTSSYTFTPSNAGCYIPTNISIEITGEIEPTFTNPGPVCKGMSFTLPSTSSNGISGTWSPIIDASQTTEYTFTPSASQSCATTAKMTVVVTGQITPAFTNPGAICSGAAYSLPTTSTNGITGIWSPAFNNKQTTTYTFSTTEYCIETVQMTVEIKPSLALQVEKIDADCAGNLGEATVSVNGGVQPYIYSWTNNTSDSSRAIALEKGEYSVTVTDLNGCSGTSSFVINTDNSFDAIPFQIPNVITPNNNGVNDQFEIPFLKNPCVDLKINFVNRWGITVFEMDKTNNTVFDGKDGKGKLLIDGIYFYQIVSNDLGCDKNENRGKCSGFIHVITK